MNIRLKANWKKGLSAFLIGTGLLTLTGCHGSKALPDFIVPVEFDTGRNYEITFWAKTATGIWVCPNNCRVRIALFKVFSGV